MLLPLTAIAPVFTPLAGKRVGLVHRPDSRRVEDLLTAMATEQLLTKFGVSYAVQGPDDETDAEVLVLFSSDSYGHKNCWQDCACRLAALATGKPCVLLPQTAYGTQGGKYAAAFVRDHTSLKYVPESSVVPDPFMCYDPGLEFGKPTLELGEFFTSSADGKWPGRGADIAARFTDPIEYLRHIASHRRLLTDSTQVAICGLLAGRSVTLLPTKLHQQRSVYYSWLMSLGCQWAEEPPTKTACHHPLRPDICRACKIAARDQVVQDDQAGMVVVPEAPPLAIITRRDRALVTVGFGVNAQRMLAVTQPYMEAYARRVGADFVLLDWPGHPRWPMSAKFGIWRVLEHYSRLAYVDADILLRETALNLFDACEEHEFGAVDNWPDIAEFDFSNIKVGYKDFREEYGFKDAPIPWYLSAGVMVVPHHAARLLKRPTKPILATHYHEQHLVNARVLDAYLSNELKVSLLDRRCNWQIWHDKKFATAPQEAILHWAGRAPDNRLGRVAEIHEVAKLSALNDTGWEHPKELHYGWHRYNTDLRHVRLIHDDLMSGKFNRVLEIGSFLGFSTCAFLDALKRGAIRELHICDIMPQPQLLAAIKFYGLEGRVVIHRERSTELLARDRAWDFVFVDGDHSIDNCRREAELLLAMEVPVVYAHDTAGHMFEPWKTWSTLEGPPELARMFRADPRYVCSEDCSMRTNEFTQRGLFRAVLRNKQYSKVRAHNHPVPFQPAPHVRPELRGARISFVVATIGRPTLARALESISSQTRAGDELIVEWDDTGDMAATPRTLGMMKATGDWVMFMDDDDRYSPGAIDRVRAALLESPGRPHLFGMFFDNTGVTIPNGDHTVRKGNVATQMIAVPNDKSKLGQWGPHRLGDLKFVETTLAHYPDGPVWHDEVIARWSGQRIMDPVVEAEEL